MCKFDVSLHPTYTKLTLWGVSFSVSLHQTYTKFTLQFIDFGCVLMMFIVNFAFLYLICIMFVAFMCIFIFLSGGFLRLATAYDEQSIDLLPGFRNPRLLSWKEGSKKG